jgi:type I restriction enzyme S subunit
MRKPYSEYKNTKIDWLKTIPKNWKLVKLKHISSLNMGQSPSSDDVNQEGEGIPFIQGNAEFGELHPTPKNFCTVPTKICSSDDILISVRAPVGALNIANQKYVIGRGLSAITPKSVSREFCWYALHNSKYQLSVMETGTTFKAISGSDLGNVFLTLPSTEEQRAIVEYLNFETSRVDNLVSEKQNFINLLKEK